VFKEKVSRARHGQLRRNVGDYVTVHVGFARSGWMRADAIHTFGYLKRLAELDMSAGRREIRR